MECTVRKKLMFSNERNKHDSIVRVRGKPHRKQVVLADANIPYKLSADRGRDSLFFCINADDFSDQSFRSVVLDLNTGLASTVPGMRNGFASAVDHATGTVYLGGSDGIFRFNYNTRDIDKPALIYGMDIFDMHFHKDLYFVDTGSQNLFVYKNNKGATLVPEVRGCSMQHFVLDSSDELIFVNSTGLYALPQGAQTPVLCEVTDLNFRGAATDTNGVPYLIAQDGIYSLNEDSKRLERVLPVQNGYGLAFDKDNNIVYSDERSVSKLIPCEK